MTRPRNVLLVFLTVLAGCLGTEEPLRPEAAFAEAAARIDRILSEDREFRARPIRPVPDRPRSAPEPGEASSVTFWYYSHPVMGPALGPPERLAALNASLERVTLKPLFIGDWPFAVQKLTVSLAAGDLPDVAMVKRAWLARLVEARRAAALDTLPSADFLNDLQPIARDAFTVDGHLYGLPADGFCSVLYCNADVLYAEPPQTWRELREQAQKIRWPDTTADRKRHAIGDFPFLPALWSAGGDVVRSGRCRLTESVALDSVRFVLSLREEGLADPRVLGDPDRAFALFLRGDVAMTVASSAEFSRRADAGFRVQLAPIPGKTGPISVLSDDAIVVFAETGGRKGEAVARVLDALTGTMVMGRDAATSGSVPVRKSVAEEVSAAGGLSTAYNCARYTPLIGSWGAIESELARYLHLAFLWRADGRP
jgi:ABC-type glycerol-3-phosphate transport system substrate-binding protein